MKNYRNFELSSNDSLIEAIDSIYISNQEYFKNIEHDATCSICKNIVLDPVECNKCENHYCTRCIQIWKSSTSNTSKCPNKCSNSEFKEPSRFYKNSINKLEFNCEKECGKVISYEEYVKHVNSCKGNIVPCPTCSSMVLSHNIKQESLKLINMQKKIIEKQSIQLEEIRKEVQFLKSQINTQGSYKTTSYNQNQKKVIDDSRRITLSNDDIMLFDCKLKVEEEFDVNDSSYFDLNLPVKSYCRHYERNYHVVCQCCKFITFNCYLDHDEPDYIKKIEHKASYKYIIICNDCKEKNKKDGKECAGCGTPFYSRKYLIS